MRKRSLRKKQPIWIPGFILVLCVTLSFVFAADVRTASAHANLVRSQPAANSAVHTSPTELRLWFSEAPELRFSQIQILDQNGTVTNVVGPLRIDTSDSQLLIAPLERLPEGIYTVSWRVLSSVDGHVTAGSFAFVVGNTFPMGELKLASGVAPAGASGPTLPGVLTRWLGYLAIALLTGGFGFVPLVLQPALAPPKPRATRKKTPSPTLKAERASEREVNAQPFSHASGLFTVLVIGWVFMLGATISGVVLQAATGAGVDPLAVIGAPLATLLGSTRYGVLFWARIVLLVVIGGLLAFRQSRWWRREMAPRWWLTGLGASALILLTISLGSHAAATTQPLLPIIADLIHMMAASVWIGGLVGLLLALLWLRRTEGTQSAPAVARLVAQFSQIAIICVAALGLSGAYRAIAEIADPANLIDTPYGTMLLFKIVLIVPLLGIAALNLLFIRRRLAEVAQTGQAPARSPFHLIRQTVGSEIIFTTAVLLITGILTSLPPSREAFGAGFVVRGQAEDLRLVMTVNPAQPGLNTFTIFARDSGGRPVADAQKVAIIFTLFEHDMGETEAVAVNMGDGRYVVQGGFMPMVGTWRLATLVRRAGRDDAQTAFVVPLSALTIQPDAMDHELSPALRVLLGLEVVIGGVVVLVWSRRSRRALQWPRWADYGISAGIIVLGSGLLATGLINPTSSIESMKNPIPASIDSIGRGRVVYDANCVTCHGQFGYGDGPAAAALNPPPANLQVHLAAGHTDGQLFYWISNGISNTAMQGFADRLSESQRWDVINYIRTFANLAPYNVTGTPAPPNSRSGQ
jgi:copper transport protein